MVGLKEKSVNWCYELKKALENAIGKFMPISLGVNVYSAANNRDAFSLVPVDVNKSKSLLSLTSPTR